LLSPTTIFPSLNSTPLNVSPFFLVNFTPTGAPDAGSQDTQGRLLRCGERQLVDGPPAKRATYMVVKGDSLSRIAKQFYGDAQQWRKIYQATRDQIKNPDLIQPGQTFRIPGA
jgi:nucleoid-associated protein YgaU